MGRGTDLYADISSARAEVVLREMVLRETLKMMVFTVPGRDAPCACQWYSSMSENIARVYTNTSRRANRKQLVDNKPVYRSVLGNPFLVDW